MSDFCNFCYCCGFPDVAAKWRSPRLPNFCYASHLFEWPNGARQASTWNQAFCTLGLCVAWLCLINTLINRNQAQLPRPSWNRPRCCFCCCCFFYVVVLAASARAQVQAWAKIPALTNVWLILTVALLKEMSKHWPTPPEAKFRGILFFRLCKN